MHKQKSKLRERTQLVFIYSLMIMSILSILAVLVLAIQGYRYNRYDGKVEQGGLVQFNSQPSGATVNVDGIELANKTASKITLTSGEHTVQMSRSGFNDWKKTVSVKPGTILWLNYARLFPTKPVVSVTTKYDTVSSAITSPDHNWLAVVASPAVAELSIVKLDSDRPNVSPIAIAATDYTAAVDPTSQQFALVSWDKDSQTVLVRHDYDGKREFLVVDSRGNGSAYNVTAKLGVDATKVAFSQSDSKVLYVLTTAHELRRVSLSSSTLSGPLVANVSDFTATDERLVTYETLVDQNGKRSVGYISPGSNVAKQITSYVDDGTGLHVRVGTYYSDRYTVVAHGSDLDITKGSLPPSDSDDVISTTTVAQLKLEDGTTFLGFSPSGNRIVYAQSGDKVMTYDLELNTTATTTLAAPLAREVDWIDGYHVSATVNGVLSYYDYDGTNGQQVAASALDLPAAISSSNNYLYYFNSAGATTTLSRVRLAPN